MKAFPGTGVALGGVALGGVALGGVALGASGCDESEVWHLPHVSEERMIDPHHARAYDPAAFPAGGQAMRPPPDGAVARGVNEAAFFAGGRYVDRFPVPVTAELLDLGQARFDVTCAACHGVLGDGESIVASKMQLRKPPSLHEPRIVALPVGRIYEIVRDGYGLMGAYAPQVATPEERWGVVAYVRALQLSQGAVVRDLPDDTRAKLAREAP
jgi:mono/diheme cytochrome c family protein